MSDKDKKDYLIYLHTKIDSGVTYLSQIRDSLYNGSYKEFDQDKWDNLHIKITNVYGDKYVMSLKQFIRDRILNIILE